MISIPWVSRTTDIWWSWMLPMTWQLCLLVGAVIIVTFLIPRASPRLHYLLWCLVLVKLCLPPTVGFYTGLGQLLPSPNEKAIAVSESGKDEGTKQTVSRALWPQGGMWRQYHPAATPGVSHVRTTPIVFGLIWLFGVTAILSLLVCQCVRVHMKVRRCHAAADERILKEFWEACEECGIKKRVPLLITTEMESPVLFGPFSTKVILPQQTIDRLSHRELKTVFIHELCHLKRFDLWINWLQAILLTVYWFHPLVWLAISRIRSLREIIVDDLVLHHLEDEADVYGSSLLNVLADCSDGRFVAPGYVGIAENGVGLQRRVRRILDRHCSRAPKIGIASSMLIVVFALTFIPQARTQSPFPSTTKEKKMTANPPQLTHGFAYDVDKLSRPIENETGIPS